jgi:hypothetical protein
MRLLRTGALTIAAVVLLAGCGSSSDTTTKTIPATTTPASRANQSPRAILDEVAAAFGKVSSYHVEGTQTDKDGPSRLAADISATGDYRARIGSGGHTVDMVATGMQTFIRANTAFWRAQSHATDAVVKLLGGRWVKVPDALGHGLRDSLDKLLPQHLASCLTRSSGPISKETGRTLTGRPAVVLTDRGRRPGSSPGDLWVAATGKAYPLRETQTGPRVPGGHPDAECDDPTSTTTKGDVRFSRFNQPLHITVPPNPLDLERLARAGASTPT